MGSFVCECCGVRVFPSRTDFITDGECPGCGGIVITGGGDDGE